MLRLRLIRLKRNFDLLKNKFYCQPDREYVREIIRLFYTQGHYNWFVIFVISITIHKLE